MNRLDQYIIRQFISVLCFSIIGFLSVFVIVDLIENLDRFIDNSVPTRIVVQYYIYSLPYFISISLPMSMLISTIFSVGNIVKKNEWTAIKASGISIYRLSIPLLILGLVMSGISFFMDNKLVSFGNEKRFEIDRDYVKRKSRHKLKNSLQDVFLQKDISVHISLTKYFLNNQTGYDLTWVDLGTKTIQRRIDAKKIKWENDTLLWKLSNYSVRIFGDNGLENSVQNSEKDTLLSLGFLPKEIQQQARKPDELDYFNLTERIKQLKKNGVDTTRWEVTRYMKISFTLTNLIVVLCGIPLVLIKEKNSLSFGAGLSVFVIFGYYALIKFGQSLGFKNIVAPILSAWIGNIIFLFAGVFMLWRART